MRIGIYNHQHMVGTCPVCRHTYVTGMMQDAAKCQSRAEGIYGTDCEFINYTDLGDYPPEHLDRPGFKRMMDDIVNERIDVIVCYTLGKITNDLDLLFEFYQTLKDHHIELITVTDGKRVMEVLDKALAKRAAEQNA